MVLPATKSFRQLIESTTEKSVFDIRVTIKNAPNYFIVNVKPAMVKAFRKAILEDNGFIIEHYGTILHRGFEEPSESLKNELMEKYGLVYNDKAVGI